MKILSPVGNFESLKMAVFNGADEVYLGINDFNARNNINGFSLQTLEPAVDFAHAFDVKVLLAINILFSDQELPLALNTVVEAYNLGVDAFIVQDLGLASLIFKHYPDIELHASTQMALHNLEGVKAVEKFGFKRVVLARETSLEEIRRIKQNSQVEIEYFCQGALCVSFSGNCYLSSYLANASGNRGKCKQLCRLPFTLEKNGNPLKKGFLLSAKDFSMIDRLNDLKNAGVDVLKIEGRARRPAYVGLTTREYRNALDGKKYNKQNLSLAFNRNFTEGYFNGNGEIISNIQNHIGIKIGKVEKVLNGKNFNTVTISTDIPLSPKSTFKFFCKGVEHNTLTAYDLKPINKKQYVLTTTQKIVVGDEVRLILDSKTEEDILQSNKKRLLPVSIWAEENKPLTAHIDLGFAKLVIEGSLCERANNQPLSSDNIRHSFDKSEIFNALVSIEKLDKVFVTKQKLNEFRRTVFEQTFSTLTKRFKRKEKTTSFQIDYAIKKFEDFQLVEDINQELSASNIIFSPEIYDFTAIEKAKKLCEQHSKNFFLDTPNFVLEKDVIHLKQIISSLNIPIVANNYYALCLTNNFIVGSGMNVYNNITASIFDKPVLTAESDISTKLNFPYMTLRHCPMKNHLNAKCSNCPYESGYTYRMENGKKFSLKRKKLSTCTFYLVDKNCFN